MSIFIWLFSLIKPRPTKLLGAELSVKKLLPKLEKELDDRYHQTNRNILQGKNEFIKFQADGTFRLSTPKAEDDDEETGLSEYFPSKHYISLLEILFTINHISGFLDAFEHLQIKYNRPKPPDRTFLAGIIGYGCNIGPKKIVKISKQIHESELENTINWYFSEDNIISANDKIVAFMSQLDLPNIYRRNKELLHTSSDGQRMDVAVDSLNTGYCFTRLIPMVSPRLFLAPPMDLHVKLWVASIRL